MKTNRITATVLSLIIAISAFSSDYNYIVRQIAENNSELNALAAKASGDVRSLLPTNNLPDPEIDYDQVFGKAGQKWDLSVSQSMKWPGVYSSRSRAIAAEAEAISFASTSRKLEILLEIKQTIIKIAYAKKKIALVARQLELIDELSAKYQKSYEMGNSTILDINKLKIERLGYEHRLDDCRLELTSLSADLKALNGNNNVDKIVETIVDYPSDSILPEDEYYRLVAEYDPDSRVNSLLSKTEDMRIDQLSKEALPDFRIGYKHTFELGDHFNGFTIGMTLPFFSNRNKKAAAVSRKEAYDVAANYAIERSSAEIRKNMKEVIDLKRQLEKYSPIINDSQNAATLRKALDGGQISLLTFIQELNYFVEAEGQSLEIEYEYASALAKLNRYSLLSNGL
ncbi:MAG: TolC family protein [Muribaculaceae bacterium]|nr:TolC family protein [Muribaculaceae bacterium]